AAETALAREAAVQEQNRFQSLLNDRITRALKIATEQDLPAQPESWWKWWNDYNELQAQGTKTVALNQQYQASAVVDLVPQTGGSATGGGSGQSSFVAECLVAGTLVWTASGPQPIEKIRVGDMVLAQDAGTG